MSFVTAIVPVVPMRAEAAHRSEMVSQLLFGEMARVIDSTKEFTKIQTEFDDYTGWCQTSQLSVVPDHAAQIGDTGLSADVMSVVTCNEEVMHIPFGSPLHLFDHGIARIGKFQFVYKGRAWVPEDANFDEATIKWVTGMYLNTAYLWGGRTVFGIDCSGFTQQVFRFLGISLPRDAYQQAAIGDVVGFLQEVRCGDLAFFDNADGKIIHVGLMLDTETIIHASGKVRVDSIDNMGIINSDTGERTHRLRIIKRYRT